MMLKLRMPSNRIGKIARCYLIFDRERKEILNLDMYFREDHYSTDENLYDSINGLLCFLKRKDLSYFNGFFDSDIEKQKKHISELFEVLMLYWLSLFIGLKEDPSSYDNDEIHISMDDLGKKCKNKILEKVNNEYNNWMDVNKNPTHDLFKLPLCYMNINKKDKMDIKKDDESYNVIVDNKYMNFKMFHLNPSIKNDVDKPHLSTIWIWIGIDIKFKSIFYFPNEKIHEMMSLWEELVEYSFLYYFDYYKNHERYINDLNKNLYLEILEIKYKLNSLLNK